MNTWFVVLRGMPDTEPSYNRTHDLYVLLTIEGCRIQSPDEVHSTLLAK